MTSTTPTAPGRRPLPLMSGSYLMPTLAHASVADAMHPGVIACEPEASTTELARLMAAQHVHCVAVMGIAHDRSGESLVWGTITDLDLVRAGLTGSAATARTIAHEPTTTVEPAMSLREAAHIMIDQGVSHLLVVEPRGQRPVGVLSSLDVAGLMAWGEA